MSEIEIFMSAALGFAAALLIALLIGRLIWSYAVRIGRRRTEKSGPAAMQGLQAERDRLRAEYAMLSRRLEMRVDDLKSRLAEQMAEVSRHRNRVDQLGAELNAKDEALSEREAEIARLKEQLEPLENELAVRTQALQQLKQELSGRQSVESDLERELASARAAAREAQLSLDLDETFEGPDAPALGEAGPQQRVRSRIEALSTLAHQIETQRKELLREHAELKALTSDIARSKKRKRRPSHDEATLDSPAALTDADAAFGSGHVESLDSESRKLETTLAEAEREADKLQNELKELDAAWTAKLAELSVSAKPEGADAPKTSSEVADAPPETPDPDLPLPETHVNGKEQAPETHGGRTSGTPNVITLANRIRALQRGVRG